MARFECVGWWEQGGYGRQPMESLQLEFVDGHISGSGADVVGQFMLYGGIPGGQWAIRIGKITES